MEQGTTLPEHRTRPLKIYGFDPTRGRSAGNFMIARVEGEKLDPGPNGSRIEVVDYDSTNHRFYKPVDLEDSAIAMNAGLDPSESNPQFHQQMVYAVASETLKRFDGALGRRWSFRDIRAKDGKHGPRLRIFPHALNQANAFYSREQRALFFGYFKAADENAGTNLPGQIVSTCLSHDIVAHETTHALVDGLREHFMEPGGPDTLAFHEAFADIVAIFQHLTFQEAVLDTIQRTGGLLYQVQLQSEASGFSNLSGKSNGSDVTPDAILISAEKRQPNPLVDLAQQFGEAIGYRKALRSALGTPPDARRLDSVFEPHERGSILVAAVFDAFFTIYIRRNADLMRVARAGGARISPEELHPELAARLAGDVTAVARHFLKICIRALDYCPPFDVCFGDFLQAMITADRDLVRYDVFDYRGAIIDAFRSRGVVPRKAGSYSEESLTWCRPEEFDMELPSCAGLDFRLSQEVSDSNRDAIRDFVYANVAALKLDRERNQTLVEVFPPAYRADPDANLRVQLVAEVVQKKLRDPKNPLKSQFSRGITLIFEPPGIARYVVTKDDQQPDNPVIGRQLDGFMQYLDESPAASPYGIKVRPSFRSLHGSY